MDSELRHHVVLDRRLVEAAKPIRILSHLEWPARAYHEFVAAWKAGRPALPAVETPRLDFSDSARELRGIAEACDVSHPVGRYVRDTAVSYLTAARMLESAGRPDFTRLSGELYGRPGDGLGASGPTNLDAARHFIRASDELTAHASRSEEEVSLTPVDVARALRRRVAPLFKNHPLEIVVDPALSSRAAAGARRLRLRSHTSFHPADIEQLVQHEAFVHSATMLNGREQPHLTSLGLGAPRTTMTQEGLATFAELITTSIDLSRLRRIALRVEAIHQALEGADFIEVVRFYLGSGQGLDDSYHSTMRVFRGGDPRGRVAFTRDVIYVQGLMLTHTFLRTSIVAGLVDVPSYLFAGRLTWGDVLALEPFFRSGFLAGARHQPDWSANRLCLAAYLTWSVFADRIHLGDLKLDDFRNRQP